MKRGKTQVLLIPGGMTFKNRKDYLHYLRNRKISLGKRISWSDEYLSKSLGKDFEFTRPRMPLQDNARYEDWKIHFENHIPKLKGKVVLIGYSLGGIFLAKYLSEKKFPKKILSTYLVCPPFDNTLPDEDLVGGFKLRSDLSLIEKNSPRLYLLFSQNDRVVPISQAEKYAKKLKHARIILYGDKNGHFDVEEFPEIVQMIKADVKRK